VSSHPLNLALSPYHLTTAEPSALVALLLGSRVVTMMPTPFGFVGGEKGREQVREAVERSPAYLRLMESWRWSVPLWQAGVVGSVETSEDVGEDVHRIWQRILLPAGPRPETDPLAPLRAVMRPTLYRDQREYLDLMCADMLKGGPDPGISVVVAAGLDAFAVRHGFIAVRAGAAAPGSGGGAPAGSVWQRAESALCRRVFAVGVPVLLRASGRRILAARARFAAELGELRSAIAAAAEATSGPASAEAAERVTEAAGAYGRAYSEARAEISTGDDDQGIRIQDGFVSLTGVEMPADAALRSSLTAVRSLAARTGRGAAAARGAESAPGPLDGPEGATLFALIVKRMNIRPDFAASGAAAAASARGA